jgi:hypothetical protein
MQPQRAGGWRAAPLRACAQRCQSGHNDAKACSAINPTGPRRPVPARTRHRLGRIHCGLASVATTVECTAGPRSSWRVGQADRRDVTLSRTRRQRSPPRLRTTGSTPPPSPPHVSRVRCPTCSHHDDSARPHEGGDGVVQRGDAVAAERHVDDRTTTGCGPHAGQHPVDARQRLGRRAAIAAPSAQRVGGGGGGGGGAAGGMHPHHQQLHPTSGSSGEHTV